MVTLVAWHWHNLWYVPPLTHTIAQAVQKKKKTEEKTVNDIGQEIRKENKLRHSSFLLFNMRSPTLSLSLSLVSIVLRPCRTLFKRIELGFLAAKSQTLFVIITSISRSPLCIVCYVLLFPLPLSVTFYWEFLMNWHRNRSFIKIRWLSCQVLEHQGLPFYLGALS